MKLSEIQGIRGTTIPYFAKLHAGYIFIRVKPRRSTKITNKPEILINGENFISELKKQYS